MAHDPERRRHPRVPFHRLVQYRFDTFGELRCDYAENVGEGGLLVRADDVQAPGTMINIQFVPRGSGDLVEAMGRVIHVVNRDDGTCALGVELVNMDHDCVAAIRNIVAEHGGDGGVQAQ